MAIRTSTTFANTALATIASQFPAGSLLDIYTGTQPASSDTAPTGTLLASVPLPASPWAAAASKAVAKQNTWSVTAVGTGTAGYGRLRTAADAGTTNTTDKRIDFDITASGGGGAVTLDNTSIATGQTVTVNTLSVTL
jgi:hypothetical protein